MSSRRSIERSPVGGAACPAVAGWLGARPPRVLACAALAVLVSGCSEVSSNAQSGGPAQSVVTPQPASSAPGTAATAGASAPGTSGAAAAGNPTAEIPKRAVADFDRAVGMMRSGNATEAELEFKQISISYPQLSAPYVNLGILFRKSGRLDQSEDALKAAVERGGSSAVAWTELGVTQRLRGEFQDAAASYEKAIAADPNYAAAYRNLGVVSDLYLADPERALSAFERYKEITREDKPVSGWIAELRQRTGKPAVKPPAAPTPESPPGDAGKGPVAPEGDSTKAPDAAPTGAPGAPAMPPTAPANPQSNTPAGTSPRAGGST